MSSFLQRYFCCTRPSAQNGIDTPVIDQPITRQPKALRLLRGGGEDLRNTTTSTGASVSVYHLSGNRSDTIFNIIKKYV